MARVHRTSGFLREVARRLSQSGHVSGCIIANGVNDLSLPHTPPADQPGELRLALSNTNRDALCDLLAPFATCLPWKLGEGDVAMPEGFVGRYRFCELIGPSGMVLRPNFRLGLYLQFAETFYPMHSHAAEEIYLPISGTARWWRDGVSGETTAPGTSILHSPWERHATQTSAEPLLAVWGWTGDIAFDSHSVDGT